MPDSTPAPRLFSAPADAPTPVAADTTKLDLDGILTTRTGAVYFGRIKEEDISRVIVTVPTGDGKVRTVRPISRDQIASTRALAPADLIRLARIGPHVLAKGDVERVVPGSTKPEGEPATSGNPPAEQS